MRVTYESRITRMIESFEHPSGVWEVMGLFPWETQIYSFILPFYDGNITKHFNNANKIYACTFAGNNGVSKYEYRKTV